MDLGAFYGAYRANGQGRAAYDPRMLLYAYATGVSSSRQIERCCEVDVAFKVIAAMRVPDHSTIAEFRRRHQDAIAEVFVQVLALCAEAGLVRVGVTAFGQIKHNRGFRQFRRRGRAAARTEWRLIAATHNLLKLHQHWIAPVTA